MAFKSEKQRRWMHLHHPEIAGDWEKKYKDGGFVEDSKQANKAGDVVNAKLSIGELILNGKHLEKVEELTGVPAEQFWAEVGVPGFEGAQNPMEAKGGGVASKKDYLMKYQDGGVSPQDISGMIEKRTGSTDYDEQQQVLGNMGKFGDPGAFTIKPSTVDSMVGGGNYPNLDVSNLPLQKPGFAGMMQRALPGGKTGYAGGGMAKKEHLMGYQGGGVPIQQSLNVPSPEYEGIIPPERRKTQYATPRAGVEGYYDMGRINYTPSDTEKVSGIKGLLQRVLPGGKTGREGRKMTNEEKIEVYRASRYGDDLPESNPYYNMMNSPLNTGNAPNRRYSSEGYQKGGVTKKKKKKKKRGY